MNSSDSAEPEDQKLDDSFASPSSRIIRWMATGDTGISSETLAAAYQGVENCWAPSNYPHDGGDFGRCYRLLLAVPEVRDGFTFLARTNEVWERLIGRWNDIQHAYLEDLADPARRVRRGRRWVWEGGGRCCNLMRLIIDGETTWHAWSWKRDDTGKWMRHRTI